MKRKDIFRLAGLLLAAALALCACGPRTEVPAKVKAADLMAGISASRTGGGQMEEAWADAAADLAVRLMASSRKDGETVVLSPLSVLNALSMTALGAKGETLSQMEEVLGMDREQLKAFCSTYAAVLAGAPDGSLSLANSVWFREEEGFAVKQAFLQENADWFGADAFSAPFDETTLSDINAWVKARTKGRIPQILDRIPDNAMMYLINALTFDGIWAEKYKSGDVERAVFTKEDGTERSVRMMYSSEKRLIEIPGARGFLKPYKDGKFAFAALLPEEGKSVGDLAASLDGKELRQALLSARYAQVNAGIPRFTADYQTEMSRTLAQMGMPLAFSADADFTGMSDSPLCIGTVIHKTWISVTEEGTKAAASTAVGMMKSAAPPQEKVEIILDRPFVFLLVDTETMIPFFIGTVADISE